MYLKYDLGTPCSDGPCIQDFWTCVVLDDSIHYFIFTFFE